MGNLKPCPFCGGAAEYAIAMTEDKYRTYSVVCKSCNIGIFRPIYKDGEWDGFKSLAQAGNAWNMRADDDRAL